VVIASLRSMPRRSLASLVDPRHTAVVTQECQGAVVGPDAALAELADEARREALPNLVRLLPAARGAGARVLHCLVERRADGQGSNHNARLFAAAVALGLELERGTPGAALLPELGPEPSDLVLTRWHGLGPMGGTDLDAVLRNLGVRTIVVTGVSVNVAITNLAMDAVNLGYDVVLPRDAVAGVPADYAAAVIDHTLALLATVVTTAELLAVWSD
jgi:biuret amidohydrolase